MKRNTITALILSLLLSINSSIGVFAAAHNNTNIKNNVIEQKEIINYDSLNQKIADLASVIAEDDNLKCTSIQYAIMDNDKVIISNCDGVYSKTENRILTKDNMYGIGSISKMYTTAAVMKLVDEGKIDLDMPVTTYIPEFKMNDERYIKITPRMLLNHSSGIMGSTWNNAALFGDNDTQAHDNFLKTLSEQRLKADPGEFSVYCNDGFFLAEILVERVSGESFSKYIEDNFSKVLGLNNTKTPVDSFNRSNLAKTYTVSDDKEDPVENIMTIGAGGIYSSAEDVCKFVHAITRKDGKGILSNKSIDAMAEKEYLKGVWPTDADESIIGYGLGWDCVDFFPFNRYNIKALVKGGDTLTYHSAVITLPEYNITMAVTSSGSASTINELFASQALLEVLKAKGIISEINPQIKLNDQTSQSMPKELMKYSGLYNTGGELIDVEVKENGELVLHHRKQDNSETYRHTYGGYFMNDADNYGFKFVEEKNGEIYLEAKQYESYPGLQQMAIYEYVAQKINKNDITPETEKAWKERIERKYYIINEKYSSMQYIISGNANLLYDESGYISCNKIDNENEAKTNLKIPVLSGRDTADFKFFTKDNIEYGKFGETLCISSDAISNLSYEDKEIIIGDDGYTKWFKIPQDMKNKKLTVKSSDKSAVILYDDDGKCINDSYISKENSMTLNGDGAIAFAGNPGEKFTLEFSEK